MTPGELIIDEGQHDLNVGRRTCTLVVQNTSDRPIQVGSHYHFAETNGGLSLTELQRMACDSIWLQAPPFDLNQANNAQLNWSTMLATV